MTDHASTEGNWTGLFSLLNRCTKSDLSSSDCSLPVLEVRKKIGSSTLDLDILPTEPI